MGDHLSLDAVVATKNSAATLEKCLSSLRGFDIFIVDGLSGDCSREIAQKYGKVLSDEGKGFFAAYDLGWRQGRGEFVLFLDSDAYLLEPGRLVSQIDARFRACEDAGIVVLTQSAVVSNSLSRLVASWWEHRRQVIQRLTAGEELTPFERFYFRFFFSERLHSGSVVTGPAYAIRRKTLEKMGGMPHDADDFVLGKLVKEAGYAVSFLPTRRVMHYPRTSLRGLLREYLTFGLHYSPNARNYYSLKERIFGVVNYPLSFCAVLLVVKICPDPRQLVILPLCRIVQLVGSVLGFFYREARDVKLARRD